jgi:hypothetical protein
MKPDDITALHPDPANTDDYTERSTQLLPEEEYPAD